jgi:hypothetical protein
MLPILPGYLLYEMVELGKDPAYSATLRIFAQRFTVSSISTNLDPFSVLFYLLEVILGICVFLRLFNILIILVYQIFARGNKKSKIWKKKNQKNENKDKTENKAEGDDSELASEMEEVDETSEVG